MSEKKKPSNSLKIAKFFGIEVYVHWTFLFLVALVILVDQLGGVHGIVNGLIWIIVIFVSVLMHELAHCVVAVRDGVVVDDILLLPIGGVSQIESIPKVPREELAIAVVRH
jgi:Zn-dependent protease